MISLKSMFLLQAHHKAAAAQVSSRHFRLQFRKPHEKKHGQPPKSTPIWILYVDVGDYEYVRSVPQMWASTSSFVCTGKICIFESLFSQTCAFTAEMFCETH